MKGLKGSATLPEDRNERKRGTKGESPSQPAQEGFEHAECGLLVEALRYMRLSTAAYGRVTLRPGPGVVVNEKTFLRLLCQHAGGSLDPEKAADGRIK